MDRQRRRVERNDGIWVLAAMVAGMLSGGGVLKARADERPSSDPGPNAIAKRWFEDAKFGLFIHWGVYSLLGKGEWVMNNDKIPISEYEKLPPRFNPVKFDAEEWVKLAKAAGMKYITVTTKHHDGFCMFDSKLTSYDIVDASPYGKDPMKALAERLPQAGPEALLLLLPARLAPPRLPSPWQNGPVGRARGEGRLEEVRGVLPGPGSRALHQLWRDRRPLV